jgi:hypothetical protein
MKNFSPHITQQSNKKVLESIVGTKKKPACTTYMRVLFK